MRKRRQVTEGVTGSHQAAKTTKRFGLGNQMVTVGDDSASGSGCGQKHPGRLLGLGIWGYALRVDMVWRAGAQRWPCSLYLEALGDWVVPGPPEIPGKHLQLGGGPFWVGLAGMKGRPREARISFQGNVCLCVGNRDWARHEAGGGEGRGTWRNVSDSRGSGQGGSAAQLSPALCWAPGQGRLVGLMS